MLISIPSALMPIWTNVPDKSMTLADFLQSDGTAIEISNGLEISVGTDVYSYIPNKPFVPPAFDPTNEHYNVGDIVVEGGKLKKISGKDGQGTHTEKRHKQPEEYAGFDTTIDHTKWAHRYFRVLNGIDNQDFMRKQFHHGARWYYLFFEDRGHGGCGHGGWRWSAKDVTANGKRHHTHYLRSCMIRTYSETYDPAKDIKASIESWGASGRPVEDTIQFHSMINRGKYFYFRTTVNKPAEYVDFTVGNTIKYGLSAVESPMDIKGFQFKRKICSQTPFDNKSYTGCNFSLPNDDATWKVVNVEPIDCIAFGRITADAISIKVTDEHGVNVFNLDYYPIDNSLGTDDLNYPITSIIYFGKILREEHTMTITLHGASGFIGTFLAGLTLNVGFTDTKISNEFIDLSPADVDKWGNVEYISGVKVQIIKGSCDLHTYDYDRINRILVSLGGRNVIMNGSDSTDNTPPDSIQVFQATMLIGRFSVLRQSTKQIAQRLDHTATYSFEFKEGV